ncbi:50S ribosomal protein L18 [Legionella yabuuchiae]|uniref:50S ribosomal protein L18 n=1 Tax=Legionella yabuuchiae TaxID=376727 RepID=UPI001056C055|nr:50S ribosomal protein L18 [Legionella yabuuchiae]
MNKHTARKRRGLKTKYNIRNSSRLRLVVYRSASHIYSQIVERTPEGDKVVAASSTLDKELRTTLSGNKSEQAAQVGKLLAQRAKQNKIEYVAFDRSGYKYHGRVKALAEAAREAGLEF